MTASLADFKRNLAGSSPGRVMSPHSGERGWIEDSDRVIFSSATSGGERALWELCVPNVEELASSRRPDLEVRARATLVAGGWTA